MSWLFLWLLIGLCAVGVALIVWHEWPCADRHRDR